jgi:hypothetical protein
MLKFVPLSVHRFLDYPDVEASVEASIDFVELSGCVRPIKVLLLIQSAW